MASAEDDLRHRLTDGTEPSDLNADEVWRGVAAGLPDPIPAPAARPRRWVYGLLFLAAGITALWVGWDNKLAEGADAGGGWKTEEQGRVGAPPNQSPAGAQPSPPPAEPPGRMDWPLRQSSTRGASPPPVSDALPSPPTVHAPPAGPKNPPDELSRPDDSRTDRKPVGLPTTAALSPVSRGPASLPPRTIKDGLSPAVVHTLPAVPIPLLATAPVEIGVNRLLLPAAKGSRFVRRPARPWSVALRLGTNLEAYRAASGPGEVDWSTVLSPAPGQAASFSVRYRLRPRWSVAAGLGLRRVHHTFSLVSERDSSLAWSGNPTNPRRVPALAVRTVRENNLRRELTLPLLLGYHGSWRNWLYGFEAGWAYHRVLGQGGKLLDAGGDVAAFGGAGEPTHFPAGYWTVRLGLTLSYQLGPTLALESNLSHYRGGFRSGLAGTDFALWGGTAGVGLRFWF